MHSTGDALSLNGAFNDRAFLTTYRAGTPVRFMSDLVIGLCVGYRLETLKPFLTTWGNLEDVDLCFYVADLDLSTLRTLKCKGVLLRDARPHLDPDLHMQTSRYSMYRELLNEIGDRYDRFFLTDAADVYFHSNPFDCLPDAQVVFTEDPLKPRHSRPNRDWLYAVGGDVLLQALLDSPILYGGTTFGSRKGISDYVDRMLSLITNPG